jgi:hypothetical protein
MSGATVILIGVVGAVALKDLPFCGERRRCRLPSAERRRCRRDIGVGQAQQWEKATGSVGHELSRPIDGRGHSRG